MRAQNVKAVVTSREFGTRSQTTQNTTAQVQVLVDGAEHNTPTYVGGGGTGYLAAIWNGFLAARTLEAGSALAAPVQLEVRYLVQANAVRRLGS